VIKKINPNYLLAFQGDNLIVVKLVVCCLFF